MARVRIFLCTYRRPHLLRRALRSLLAQTHPDWVCELHNDAPDDDAPRQILAETAPGDPRIVYRPHERNFGAVATFNLAYAGGPEPFASILEDDNWWEPTLLESLLGALADRPDAALAWSNMRLWDEHPDGSWIDTGRTVWDVEREAPAVVTIHPAEVLQAVDAVHSHGAMVFRPDRFHTAGVPATSTLAIIESLRERSADGPMLLLTQPLANFASTIASARNEDATHWLQAKLLLAASFFQKVRIKPADMRSLWASRRAMTPPDIDMFFQLAWTLRRPELVAPARPGDWLTFLLRTLRRPGHLIRALRFREEHVETWRWLIEQTAHFPNEGRATWTEKHILGAQANMAGTIIARDDRTPHRPAKTPSTIVSSTSGASVRVIVPTYRRPHLLPRALRSLQAQNFPDWIAEVHNDAPDDPAPSEVVRSINDPRIRYVHHREQVGATTLFNQVYREHPEPFVALLEDDNWWHPAFLATMQHALRQHPDVVLAWSNQDRWAELPDGSWQDAGRTVRPLIADPAPIRVHWPQAAQCFGALHANGSMVLRAKTGASYETPQMSFGGSEAVRERCLPHPLLYVPQPLAVFAVTRETNRSRSPVVWATTQTLLAATFLKHAPLDHAACERLWQSARKANPRMTGTLILATRQDRSLQRHLVHARPADWLHLAIRGSRRPMALVKLLRARQWAPDLWNFLEHHTAARTREMAPSAQKQHPRFPI